MAIRQTSLFKDRNACLYQQNATLRTGKIIHCIAIMNTFQDKVIWITGASAGIGAAFAQECAAVGARLVLSARRESALNAVAMQIGIPAERCLILPLDLAEPEMMAEKAAQVMAHFGQVDYLLHNGGISQRSLVCETDFGVFRRLIEVNYLGTVALTQAVLPAMIAQGSGHFAVVSSLVGKFGTPMRAGYAGSKHALHGFFDSLRAELWADGIRVTLICPGFIRTDVSINALTADGSPQKTMDATTGQGLAPAVCARRMLKAIRRKKEEVYIGKKEVAAVYLKRYFPRIFSRILRKAKVT